jgi:hypothetical protein
MTITHSTYNLETGELSRIVTCPEDMVDTIYNPLLEGIVEGAYIGTIYYFDGVNVVPKATFTITQNKVTITSDDVDVCTITNIPTGTAVLISSSTGQQAFNVTDGLIEFSTSQPDIYRLKFTNVQFLDLELTINAN